MRPESGEDWLIVAGDVGTTFGDIERALRLLQQRYAKVIWVPGNHELWTHNHDPMQLRGAARYEALVQMCRDNVILTPRTSLQFGPARPDRSRDHRAALSALRPLLARARHNDKDLRRRGDVAPRSVPDRESWCDARLKESERRLSALGPDVNTVLVSHWPLVRQPTDALRFPQFARWCGTSRTAYWHTRFRAEVAVYGHLHITRTTHYDDVRFEEVSLGYSTECRKRAKPPATPKKVLAG